MSQLSKADLIYKELIEDIYINGIWDKGEDVRTVYSDDSPAYTKSVFGKQVVFEEGEIPLLTTKHVGWKTAFKEMRLFWLLQTVKQEDFNRENVKVWNEWFKNGSLGKSYAYQFESNPTNRKIVEVIERKKMKPTTLQLSKSNSEKELPNFNNHFDVIGQKFTSYAYGDFIVLDVEDTDRNHHFSRKCKVQFVDTNYISNPLLKEVFGKRQIRDNFKRSVYNIGYLGEGANKNLYSKEEYEYLKNVWRNMISRCYNKKDVNYKNYGEKGVFVDERWHNLDIFLLDVFSIPQFFLAKRDSFRAWNLDKDYYQSNCYSENTCVWLHVNDNIMYAKSNGAFIIKNKEEEELCISQSDTKRKYGLNNLSAMLSGDNRYSSIKGYTGYYIEKKIGMDYRYELSCNQVVDLINNIKSNPMSRRLMTSFWNDADVKDKVLQECAMQTTWNVRNGKLDLLLYSRSVDTALGLPFNWIQYWFLLQLVAKSTGLKAGRFIHQMGNVHYYDRHEDKLMEQINNKSNSQPLFSFTTNNENFFNFTLDDIHIENYISGGKFDYEVAI